MRIRTWLEIPYGYQDENGFHYGPQPAPKNFTDSASKAMTYPQPLPASPAEVVPKSSAAVAPDA